MKKHILALLVLLSGFGPLKSQHTASNGMLQRFMNRLDHEYTELKKCVRLQQDCDPIRQKMYGAATIFFLILGASFVGTKVGDYFSQSTGVPGSIPVPVPQPPAAESLFDLPQTIQEAEQAYEIDLEMSQALLLEVKDVEIALQGSAIMERIKKAKAFYSKAQQEQNEAKKLEWLKKAVQALAVK